MRALASLFLIVMLFATVPASAAEPDLALARRAAAAYDAKDWAVSAQLYGELSRNNPDPRTWNRLGISLNHTGRHDEAIAAFEAGMKAGLPQPNAEYGIASAYGAKKNRELALQYLERAVEHGLNLPEQMTANEDLILIRNEPRFAALVVDAARNLKPAPTTRTTGNSISGWVNGKS